MPEKQIISLENAQIAAERFLEERLKRLKKISVFKVNLSSVEGIVIYDVEGRATIGTGLWSRVREHKFRIQVAAVDGAVVGYETE